MSEIKETSNKYNTQRQRLNRYISAVEYKPNRTPVKIGLDPRATSLPGRGFQPKSNDKAIDKEGGICHI
ncbi:MAG: hypothetical protein ABSA77_00545 [Thermoguttaceae bacterium]